jgi:hypothetical protein
VGEETSFVISSPVGETDRPESTSLHLRLLVVADQSMAEHFFDENLDVYVKTIFTEVEAIFKWV